MSGSQAVASREDVELAYGEGGRCRVEPVEADEGPVIDARVRMGPRADLGANRQIAIHRHDDGPYHPALDSDPPLRDSRLHRELEARPRGIDAPPHRRSEPADRVVLRGDALEVPCECTLRVPHLGRRVL